MAAEYDLVYFPIRGRAEGARLLFEDNGIPYKETNCGPWDNFVNNWKEKLLYGQCPLLREGSFELTQSNTILRYLGRKHNLYGCDAKESAKIDELNDGVEDVRNAYIKLIYFTWDVEGQKKENYIPTISGKFKPFEKIIAGSKGHETGAAINGRVSYADYNLFDLCNVHEILSPGCLNEFKCLKAWHTKFAARPKIAAYQQSEAFKSRGINGNPNK